MQDNGVAPEKSVNDNPTGGKSSTVGSPSLAPVALKITITYAIAGALWILLSDKVLGLLTSDPAALTHISIIKGWLFIVLTSLMLYALINRSASRMKRSEKEARLAESKYRDVVRSANIIIIQTDLAGRITLFNRFAQEFFGYSQQEVLGRNAVDAIIPEKNRSGIGLEEMIRDTTKHPARYGSTEIEHMRKNGERIWVAWAHKPVLDRHGRIEGYLCVGNDITERKSAEEVLRESEQRFRNMSDAAPAMLWVTEPDGACTFVSRGWYEFTGQTEQTALGFGWLDAVHPDDLEATRQCYQSVNNRCEPFDIDYRLCRTDGEYRWVIDAGRPRYSSEGEFLGYIGSVIDITERKEMEKALAESEKRFQDILNKAPSVIYVKDRQGRYTFVNSHFEKLSGFRREEVLDRTDMDLFPHDVAVQSTDNDQKALGMQTPLETEEIAPVGGEMHTFISAKFPLYDSRGEAYAICGISTDINERKRAEKASKDMLRFMHTLLDTIPSPIFYKDGKGRYMGCNKAFEEHLGLRKEQIIGKVAFDIFPNDLAQKYHSMDLALFGQPGKHVYESQALYADGKRYDVIANEATFVDAEGSMAGLVGVLTDITERKSAEVERERLIGELQSALGKVRQLSGFLPICASCKKIRDDKGYWQQIEAYIRDHSEAEFSHSLCPDCARRLYPDLHKSGN
jgi:PAS domain S-box-containing protein